jgi:hypothetical protein
LEFNYPDKIQFKNHFKNFLLNLINYFLAKTKKLFFRVRRRSENKFEVNSSFIGYFIFIPKVVLISYTLDYFYKKPDCKDYRTTPTVTRGQLYISRLER